MIKKLFDTLFNKKNVFDNDIYVVAQLNDKLMPIDRGLVYEDPLGEFLVENHLGEVTGGGTVQKETGELSHCDIEIQIKGNQNVANSISNLIDRLEQLGAPKGSKMIVENEEEIPFGKLEGLAIYLDGKNLSPEVYAESDINFVLSELHRLTQINPNADRYWEGQNETALYFYGESFEKMKSAISEFTETYPLCMGARIVQIA